LSRFVINPWRMKMKWWVYEYHVFELRDEWNFKKTIAVIDAIFVVTKRNPEKKNGKTKAMKSYRMTSSILLLRVIALTLEKLFEIWISDHFVTKIT